MTAAEKIEQIFTGHPTSLVGGRVLESLLNLSPRTDGDMFKLNIMMNAVRGAGAGILRAMMSFNGMRGPVADFMLVGIGLIVDNMLEVKAGVGSWAW